MTFSSAEGEARSAPPIPPSSRTRCSCTPRSSQRNAAGPSCAGASPSAANSGAHLRVGARARRRRPKRARARARLAASRSALVMIFWVTGVPVFISFLSCTRSRSFGVARRDRPTRSPSGAAVRVTFPREASPQLSVYPSAGSLDALPRVPEHQHAADRERGERRRDRSTATVGVISAVTPSQYPGSLRPTRADTSRRCAPAHRDAREPKTSPCASARTFRREGARRGRRDARARRRRGERCRETDMVTARCAGPLSTPRVGGARRVMRTTVTMTLS